MKRVTQLLLATGCNLGIWLLVALFGTSEFYRRSIVMGGGIAWDEILTVQICTALIWAAFTPLVVLIAQRLPLRPPHLLRNAIAIVAFLPYLAVFRAAFGGAVLNLGEHQPIAWSMVHLSIGIRTHRDIAILAAIFFLSNFVDAHREAAERERQRMRAQTLLARTEIDELRARLQPQFALRMLRHIGDVLRDAPQIAEQLIVELGALLRRSISRGANERILLADELEHLDRCLDLCRAGGRFSVTTRYVADEEVLACSVPALALQPVIESVVLDLTSGDGGSVGGSVEVRCEREQGEAKVDVCWTIAPAGSPSRTTLRIPCAEALA